MSLPLPDLLTHTLFMTVTGIVLAACVLAAALATGQGNRLYTLLLLVLLPATALALTLPLLLPPDSTALLPFLQGMLIGPAISLAPLRHLKSAPSAWTLTAQELGAHSITRLRLLWLPLLGRSLAGSLCLAGLLSLLATVGLGKVPLS